MNNRSLNLKHSRYYKESEKGEVMFFLLRETVNKIQFVINSIQINGINFILNILCVCIFVGKMENNLQTNSAKFCKICKNLF